MGKPSTASYYKNNEKARKRRMIQQKAYMQTAKGKSIRREADRLAAKLPGGKVGDGLDASHNKNGPGKHGWEKASSNRKSRLKVKRKSN